MKQTNSRRKFVLFFAGIMLLAIATTGCSKQADQSKQTSQKATSSLGTLDNSLSSQVRDSKEVSNAQVNVQKDSALCLLIMKDGVGEDVAKKIAQENANNIKKKYADKKVEVQVFMKGKYAFSVHA